MTRAGADTSQAPLLSVCIPTFNRAEFLAPALDSFVAQIGDDAGGAVEIVICDNASTDRTREVAAEFCRRYPYVRYKRNAENLGVEPNIFEALNMARGEYAWVFGDDDLVVEGAFEKLWPHLSGRSFDFLMMNKTVKNVDMTVTLLERQNETDADRVFPNVKELCCEFGYFTQLGFISTAVFRRAPFLAVERTPYLHNYYPHNGIWLEAFRDSPCLYLSDALVVQRQQNQRVDERSVYYVLSVYALRTFKALASRGVVDYSIIERIWERPLDQPACSLADYFSFYLIKIVREGGVIRESEWADVMEVYFGLPSEKYKRLIVRIFSDYLLKTTADYVAGAAGKAYDLRPDAETVFDEARSRFGAGRLGGDELVGRFVVENECFAGFKKALESYRGLVGALTEAGRGQRLGLRPWANFSKVRGDLPRLSEELAEVADDCRDRPLASDDGTVPNLEKTAQSPRLVEENYRRGGAAYNIVHWLDDYYAIPQSMGPVDVTRLGVGAAADGDIISGKSVGETKRLVARRSREGRAR